MKYLNIVGILILFLSTPLSKAHKADGPQWESARTLQVLIAHATWLMQHEPASMEGVLPKVEKAAQECAGDKPPGGIRKPFLVRVAQEDLAELASELKVSNAEKLLPQLRETCDRMLKDAGASPAAEGPHHGLCTVFFDGSGKMAGWLELKLHDDKGDLELWTSSDAAISKPHDLGLDSVIRVELLDKNREVKLQVRNRDRNEDEDGKANNRSGLTNYFIFPGDTGEDARWLQGKKFASHARIHFEQAGVKYHSAVFQLVPHTH